jgi:hypothetical protein
MLRLMRLFYVGLVCDRMAGTVKNPRTLTRLFAAGAGIASKACAGYFKIGEGRTKGNPIYRVMVRAEVA